MPIGCEGDKAIQPCPDQELGQRFRGRVAGKVHLGRDDQQQSTAQQTDARIKGTFERKRHRHHSQSGPERRYIQAGAQSQETVTDAQPDRMEGKELGDNQTGCIIGQVEAGKADMSHGRRGGHLSKQPGPEGRRDRCQAIFVDQE